MGLKVAALSVGRYAMVVFAWLILSGAVALGGMSFFSALLSRVDRGDDLALVVTATGVVALAIVFTVFLRTEGVDVRAWVAIAIGCAPFAFVAAVSAWEMLSSRPAPVAGQLALMLADEARAYAVAGLWGGLGVAVGAPLAAFIAGRRSASGGGI